MFSVLSANRVIHGSRYDEVLKEKRREEKRREEKRRKRSVCPLVRLKT
jgi:hypothetical protein